jgi:hypothetical protein
MNWPWSSLTIIPAPALPFTKSTAPSVFTLIQKWRFPSRYFCRYHHILQCRYFQCLQQLLDQFDRFLWLILNFPMVIAIPALPQIVHIIEIATAASLLLTTLWSRISSVHVAGFRHFQAKVILCHTPFLHGHIPPEHGTGSPSHDRTTGNY